MPRLKPFQYNTLLRIRKRQEDLRAQALAAARRDVRGVERRLDEIGLEQTRTLMRAGKRASRGFTASDVRRYYQYERYLAHLATQSDAELAELRVQAQERRQELGDAMKRRRILERLKERRQQAFETELNKEMQAMADEVATNYAAIARSERRRAATEEAAGTHRGAP